MLVMASAAFDPSPVELLGPDTIGRALVFSVCLLALLVAHQVGDHVLQSDRQAAGKVDSVAGKIADARILVKAKLEGAPGSPQGPQLTADMLRRASARTGQLRQQLNRWHDDDRTADRQSIDETVTDDDRGLDAAGADAAGWPP